MYSVNNYYFTLENAKNMQRSPDHGSSFCGSDCILCSFSMFSLETDAVMMN